MSSNFQYPFNFSFQDELHFDTFTVSEANAPLVHFLENFANDSAQFCYLWGQEGSGKTHLLQALSHASDTAIYLPFKDFLSFGPESLQGLENYDFLVLDDVHLLAGSQGWEEALFYLFNALHNKQSKICMSANVNPLNLPLDLADLKSRLQLAVVYEVRELDEAEKCEALIQRAALRGIALKTEVAKFIMSHSERNMHALTEVLLSLDTLSLSEKRGVTIPFIKMKFDW